MNVLRSAGDAPTVRRGGGRNPAVHSQAADRFLALTRAPAGRFPLAAEASRRDRDGVDLGEPRFVFRDELLAVRSRGLEAARLEGLWVAGELAALGGPTVAIVGSRAPSDGARARAHELAAGLASAGVCVVSGLAHGIDGAAHAGALAAGGCTVGVLGGGHRCFYPPRNEALAREMLARGAVLSPFPPDAPAFPSQFLERNGVVAALSDAVVVVEAAKRSGALNTASWAANLGVPVLTFPGDVDRPKAAGCNALIRDGATLVRGLEDVLEALSLDAPASVAAEGASAPRTDPLERAIVAALGRESRDLEELVRATGADAAALMAALVRLEIEGVLKRRDIFGYALCGRTGKAGRQ